jgi:hypothetical protein
MPLDGVSGLAALSPAGRPDLPLVAGHALVPTIYSPTRRS